MKNITVSLDDELYRKSRVAAAESDTTVTALVREFLTQYTAREQDHVGETDDRTRAVLRVIDKMRARHPEFRTDNLLSRDELHERGA